MKVEKRCHNTFCSNLVTTLGKYCKGCAIKKQMGHSKKFKCLESNCETKVKVEGSRCFECNLQYRYYLPTPEEIAKECEAIRKEWDERDFRLRTAYKNPRPDFTRVVKKVS
jgi:hypothetical protein